jgi:hypothetical protein
VMLQENRRYEDREKNVYIISNYRCTYYKRGLIILKDKYEIISEIYIIVLLLYMYVFRLNEGKYEKAIRLVRAFLIFILLFYSDLRLWS